MFYGLRYDHSQDVYCSVKVTWGDNTDAVTQSNSSKLIVDLACGSSPCENGGTCHNLGLPSNQLRCDCLEGYQGPTCSTTVWCLSEQACGDHLEVDLTPGENVIKSAGDSTTYTCNYGIPIISGRFLYQVAVFWYSYDSDDNYVDILWAAYTYTADNRPYDEPNVWGRRNSNLSASGGKFPGFYTSHQLTFNHLKPSDSQVVWCMVQLTWNAHNGPFSDVYSPASQLIVGTPQRFRDAGRGGTAKSYADPDIEKNNVASSIQSGDGAPPGLVVGLAALIGGLGLLIVILLVMVYMRKNAQKEPVMSEGAEGNSNQKTSS